LAVTTLSKPPSPEATVFNETQYVLPYSPGVERHFWNYARSRIIERHLRRSNSKIFNHDALVLDVGCGVGLAVDYLRRVGIDCQGVELGRPKVRPGLDDFAKIGTDARDLPPEIRERTGTILLLDVLEHIYDPVAFLGELRANFPRLERILITVPARMELWSNYDVYYGHFLRYDKRQFALLADRAALEIITLKYFFVGLYPLMWIFAHLVRQRSLATTPPGGMAAWIHSLVGTAFTVEERLPFFGALPGTSLLGILLVRQDPIR
jgi:SAM-dependent methyltransferase